MYVIYNFLIILFFIFSFPYYLVRILFTRKYRAGLKERLGFINHRLDNLDASRKRMWIHAVSVGEVIAASLLIKRIKELWPDLIIMLTTVTETGNRTAKEKIKEADVIAFFPLDFSWSVRRFKKSLKPDLCIIMETELWPNFLRILSENGTPIMIANGRLSEKSYSGYKIAKAFFKKVLKSISAFSMQTDSDAGRIAALGAEQSKIYVTGNLKFDQVFRASSQIEKGIRADLMIPEECKVLVFGSTHRGEEEILVGAYKKLRSGFKNLFLIIAPRHPERFGEVEGILTRNSVSFCRRTLLKRDEVIKTDAMLLDTIGELSQIYSIASVVFIGGTLVPVGGHNILEPAVFKKPVFFGKYMHNFREIAELFVNSGGGIQVHDPSEIEQRISDLLSNPEKGEEIGRVAYSLFEKNLGATERTLDLIKKFFPLK